MKMEHDRDLVEHIRALDRYQRMIDAAPPEARKRIVDATESFLRGLSVGLSDLKAVLADPETRRKYQEELAKRQGKGKG